MSGENDVCTLLERISVAQKTLIKTFPSWIFSSQKSRLCPDVHILKAPVWPVCHSILIWSDWEIERLLALLQTFDPFNLELRRPSSPLEQPFQEYTPQSQQSKWKIWNSLIGLFILELNRPFYPFKQTKNAPKKTVEQRRIEHLNFALIDLFNLELRLPCYLFK